MSIILENKHYVLKINEGGYAESLIHKASGEECLDTGAKTPMFSLTEPRLFNNELKLAHPHKRTTFLSNRIRYEDGKLVVGFNLIKFEANIGVTVKDDYIAFELLGYNISFEDFGYLRISPPPVESFRLLALPIKERKNFGEWLNVMSDERVCVNVLSTSPYAIVDSEKRENYRILTADALKSVKLEGTSAALIVSSPEEILDCIDSMECDFGLPRGAKNRRGDLIDASIFWTQEINPENADELIAYAKAGGFKLMLIYYNSFTKKVRLYDWCGDYDYDETYPRGDEDLKLVLDKIHAAGMHAGLHVLHTHIGKNTSYITPVCDRRINLSRHFTLAQPLSAEDTTVYVEENPTGTVMHPDVRVLRFNGELIYYDSYTTEWPYKFEGCKRGFWDTTVRAHELGTVGGLLDMSEYGGVSAYLSQNSSLQDEIADKIKRIYDLGFEFMYFDGSEGVQPPYAFHVANAQYRVYKKLEKEPIFCEGAAKAHFSWHMLAGGNAFDIFSDEAFKTKIVEHPFEETERMAHDLTRVNFGWWAYRTTTQPDLTEYGMKLASSKNCPATYQMWIEALRECPRTQDVLEVMRRWEDVREKRLLTPEQKIALQDTEKEHILLINEQGEYELCEYKKLDTAAGGDTNVRAFTFKRLGKSYAVIWHTTGDGKLYLPLAPDAFKYEDELGGEIIAANDIDGGSVIPLSKRRYISTELSMDALVVALSAAKLI